MTAALSDAAPSSMLDRFTAIIDAFDDDTAALTLDQISARTALPRSSTHRILDQLVRLDWLTHNGRGYRLGPRANGRRGAEVDVRLRSAAAPALHDLLLRTGAVVHLGVLHGGHIVHLDKLGGHAARQVPTAVGARVRAHRTALGVAALSGMSPEEAEAELAGLEGWVPDAGWWADLHRARRRVAVRHDDYAPGLVSLAAAVGSRAAIGLVTPDRVLAQRCQPLVAAAAARVARALAG